MKKFFSAAVCVLLSAAIITGCSSDDSPQSPNPPAPVPLNLVKIDSGSAAGAKAIVALYAASSLKTGYNELYAAVYDSATGAAITDAHVSFMPMMDMGTMVHSAPYENPGSAVVNGKWFRGAVVFIMPSSGMMGWTVEVHVHNHSAPGEPEGMAEFNDLSVSDNGTKYKTIGTADGSRLYLSYIEPASPVVGINDLEFTVHKRNTMMSYPADSSYTTTIYPWMPSMGHSSPNNVNPAHYKAGHYKGKVNFTMTGDWQIKVYLQKNGQTDSTYFDLIF